MHVTDLSSEGLKRAFKITVPATEIGTRVDRRLSELSGKVKMPGFRPGKVPMGMLKKRYGPEVFSEVVNETVELSTAKAMQERNIRPALEPKVELASEFAEGRDLEYTVEVETLPEVEPAALEGIALERAVVTAPDKEIDEALARIAKSNATAVAVEQKRPAGNGDVLSIDFDGSVDGERRPGMKGEGYDLELGGGQFIPGFEEALIGAQAGETRTIDVTFPVGYAAEELSGKAAKFDVTVHALKELQTPAIDDELAKSLGLENVGALREAVRQQIEGEYSRVARMKLKRELLDALASRHDFPVPQGMVELEFQNIWLRVQQELADNGGKDEDGKTEDELKDEYRSVAERRVRLGLLLSEIGRRESLTVTQEELNRALIAEARRHRGQEKAVLDFYRQNPRALDRLRAPIYEDKVVDHILSKVAVTDRPTTIEELRKDWEEDEAE
jgi:trigger factor